MLKAATMKGQLGRRGQPRLPRRVRQLMSPIAAIPESSINRVTVGDNCPFPNYRGWAGRDLLSSRAIDALCQTAPVRHARESLETRPQRKDRHQIENEFIRRLAALLHSLLSGNARWPVPPQGPIDRIEQIRRGWMICPRVLLGGGYLALLDGKRIAGGVGELLNEWKLADRQILLADNPAELPIHGAARGQKAGTLVLDYGHSAAKSMVAGTNIVFTRFPMGINAAHEGWDLAYAREVLSRYRLSLEFFHQQYSRNPGGAPPGIAISLAAYLDGGQFIENHRGGYCKLRMIDRDFNRLTADLWEEIAGQRPAVTSWHDGAAAARNLRKPGAVLVFGTAIGHGFYGL